MEKKYVNILTIEIMPQSIVGLTIHLGKRMVKVWIWLSKNLSAPPFGKDRWSNLLLSLCLEVIKWGLINQRSNSLPYGHVYTSFRTASNLPCTFTHSLPKGQTIDKLIIHTSSQIKHLACASSSYYKFHNVQNGTVLVHGMKQPRDYTNSQSLQIT